MIEINNKYIQYAVDPLTVGLIGASTAGSILGAVGVNKGSYTKWRQSFDHSHRANIEDWNMQNEYNLPINQLKRLRDAGINPNFMLSSGQISSSGAAVSPATGANIPQQNVGAAAASGATQGMQIAQMVSAKQNTDADTDLKRAQAKGQEIQNELDDMFGAGERSVGIESKWSETKLNSANTNRIVKMVDKEIALMESNKNLSDEQVKDIQELREYKKQLLGAQRKQAESSAHYSDVMADEEPKRTQIHNRGVTAQERANEIKQMEVNNQFLIDSQKVRYMFDDLARQTNYDKGILSIQSAAQKSLDKLQISESKYNDSKTLGQDVLNGISAIEFSVKNYVHEQGWDIHKENVLIEKFEEEVKNLRSQTERIMWDKKMTEFQKGIELQKLMIDVQTKNANFLQSIVPQIPVGKIPK